MKGGQKWVAGFHSIGSSRIPTSDFQHKNINRYCHRTTPMFPTPAAVDSLMYSNWRALVRPQDRILHLGDLCKWDQAEPIPEMRELPGKKSLVLGNHDNYRREWYEDHGFEIVDPKDIAFVHEGLLVHLTHYPMENLIPDEVNIHGHVHNNPHRSTPWHLNVSVEVTHYAPLPFKDAIEKVAYHAKRKS